MKRFLTLVAVFAFAAMNNITNAQELKFGHIDSNQLLQQMPERTKAQAELEKYAKQLEDQMAAMQTEFETKYQQYMAQADSLPPVLREAREQELANIQQRFQTFQRTAQNEMATKEGALLQPVIEKAKQAIDDVAAENGFIYIFDISSGTILYQSEKSVDILPLVLAKLGIQ